MEQKDVHHRPDIIDIARNSRGDVLVAIEMSSVTTFRRPVLLYKKTGDKLKVLIRDAQDKHVPNIIFPDLGASKLSAFLDRVPEYRKIEGQEADGRVEGHRYVLVSEVVGNSPKNVYYALLKEV